MSSWMDDPDYGYNDGLSTDLGRDPQWFDEISQNPSLLNVTGSVDAPRDVVKAFVDNAAGFTKSQVRDYVNSALVNEADTFKADVLMSNDVLSSQQKRLDKAVFHASEAAAVRDAEYGEADPHSARYDSQIDSLVDRIQQARMDADAEQDDRSRSLAEAVEAAQDAGIDVDARTWHRMAELDELIGGKLSDAMNVPVADQAKARDRAGLDRSAPLIPASQVDFSRDALQRARESVPEDAAQRLTQREASSPGQPVAAAEVVADFMRAHGRHPDTGAKLPAVNPKLPAAARRAAHDGESRGTRDSARDRSGDEPSL